MLGCGTTARPFLSLNHTVALPFCHTTTLAPSSVNGNSILRRRSSPFSPYTNRTAMKPRELSFVLNTLGEPTLGIDNVTGIADYVDLP